MKLLDPCDRCGATHRLGLNCGPIMQSEIAALRAALAEARAQLDLYTLSPGAVHDLAVECEAIRANFITAQDQRDAAEARVAELTEALNTAPEVVQCECGKVTEVWTNPRRKAAASAGKEEKK